MDIHKLHKNPKFCLIFSSSDIEETSVITLFMENITHILKIGKEFTQFTVIIISFIYVSIIWSYTKGSVIIISTNRSNKWFGAFKFDGL